MFRKNRFLTDNLRNDKSRSLQALALAWQKSPDGYGRVVSFADDVAAIERREGDRPDDESARAHLFR
ncbi:hypothetical protein SPHINGO391_220034 [Sphingomonas aurantiaca]|uniref:Uncharacterized protein n=1 Tax=Sphingomonas aurantiaca TaxID=185949 RepID=A0A5E7XVY7_9SPHN|nr:hypothetical protein SPHINGO391_220034 [Sphingomonas aurantiaca]